MSLMCFMYCSLVYCCFWRFLTYYILVKEGRVGFLRVYSWLNYLIYSLLCLFVGFIYERAPLLDCYIEMFICGYNHNKNNTFGFQIFLSSDFCYYTPFISVKLHCSWIKERKFVIKVEICAYSNSTLELKDDR